MKARTKLGYCTNVHAGVTLDEVKSNLEKYSLPIKSRYRPNQSMDIGLWLSDIAARQLLQDGVHEFKVWLKLHGLNPFTFNAFPFNNFHQPVVKHKVYEPTWADSSRLEYTLNIAKIQSELLSEGEFGSISTLPLGWPFDTSKLFMSKCAANLKQCANYLIDLKEQTGRHIFLAIEPEPGCILDVSNDVVDFFSKYLLDGTESDQNLLQHIGVCHDVCHAAVMGESQTAAVENYMSHGIQIGKFQISSAIRAVFESKSLEQKNQLTQLLNDFAEDRYLHQTQVNMAESKVLFEDLPIALNQLVDSPEGVWTVHFHVPVFASSIGELDTTRQDIDELLGLIPRYDWPIHLEVETYAWTVMPDSSKSNSLVDVVVKELEYIDSKVAF